jgi:hypothetical protein
MSGQPEFSVARRRVIELEKLSGSGQAVNMAITPRPREIYLDHDRVAIECPRLMSDEELADVLAAFVNEVRARPPKAPTKPPDGKSTPVGKGRGRKPRTLA